MLNVFVCVSVPVVFVLIDHSSVSPLFFRMPPAGKSAQADDQAEVSDSS